MKNRTPKHIVHIISRDRWSGPEIDERYEFDTIEDAEKFCKNYNKKNTAKTAPDYYQVAEYIGFL